MSNCQACQRPMFPGWVTCGWCGAEQAPQAPKTKLLVQLANLVLFIQAVALTGGTVALAVMWAMRGWSVERGQTLGIIWLGVVIALGLMAWLSVSLSAPNRGEPTVPQT